MTYKEIMDTLNHARSSMIRAAKIYDAVRVLNSAGLLSDTSAENMESHADNIRAQAEVSIVSLGIKLEAAQKDKVD